MICPHCQTENREDRERCYACDRDISMLRLIVNKARHHYNMALEHAERGRIEDAIAELQNAIDLDRTLTSAHVVLGTLYAKRNQFEHARAAWNAAFEQSPELSKAHQYLERVQQVQQVLPQVSLMQRLLLLTGILVLLLGGIVAWQFRPDPLPEKLAMARVLYDAGNFGDALDLLRTVERQAERPDLAAAAAALSSAITAQLRAEVSAIQELKFRQDYPEALERIERLQEHRLDIATSSTLAAVREAIDRYYRGQMEMLLGEYVQGRVPYTDLSTQMQQFLVVYPEGPTRERMSEYLERARGVEVARTADAIRQRFAQTRELGEFLDAVDHLGEEYPGTSFQQEREVLVEDAFSSLFEEFQESLGRQDFELAGQILDEIEEAAPDIRDIIDMAGPVALARNVLRETEKAARFAAVESLVDSGGRTDAEEALIELLADRNLTPAERNLALSLNRRMDTRLAMETYDELLRQRDAISRLTLSEDETSAALATLRLRGPRLVHLAPAQQGLIALFEACLLARLGELQDAAEALDRARELDDTIETPAALERALRARRRR